MAGLKNILVRLCLVLVITSVLAVGASPVGVCIRNCAQCKRMYGDLFEGQYCAESCIKFKGIIIPDCSDYDSISNFIKQF